MKLDHVHHDVSQIRRETNEINLHKPETLPNKPDANGQIKAIDLKWLMVLNPKHNNAFHSLLPKPLKSTFIEEQEISLKTNYLIGLSNIDPGSISMPLKKAICNWLSVYTAHLNYKSVEPTETFCVLTQYLFNNVKFDDNPEEIGNYTWEAIHAAMELHDQILCDNVKPVIYNYILEIQYLGFLKDISWQHLKPQLHSLVNQLIKTETSYPDLLRPEHLQKLIIDEINNAQGYDRNKFKAYKHTTQPRMLATHIRSDANPDKIFALIKTPTNEQMNFIQKQFSDARQKRILGEGSYGTVTYGIDLEQMDVIAIKEIKSRRAAKDEIKEFKRVGGGSHLITMRGHAHTNEKTYIAMDFGGPLSGKDITTKLNKIKRVKPQEAEQKLNLLAQHLTKAVSELHQKKIYHHDIKPANFTHSSASKRTYIIDYGLSGSMLKKIKGGTLAFCPPEVNTRFYQSDRHDSFSLGLTLLTLKLGLYPHLIKAHHLTINNKKIHLRFNKKEICEGVEETSQLQGKNLDEVIAKLLERSPPHRITPEQALNLPFFK